MKKILVLLVLVFTTLFAFSQIEEKSNVIVGLGKQGFDEYDQGRYQHAYIDYQFIKSYDKTISAGLFLQGSNYHAIIDSNYLSNNQNLVIGSCFGFMPKYMFYNSDAYFSFSVGYGTGWSNGLSFYNDEFKQKENYFFLSAYNHWHTEYREAFFRYKLFASYSTHLKGKANLLLNNGNILANDSILWKRNDYAVKFDLNIYRVYCGSGNLTFSPKVILGYYNDLSYKKSAYEIGLGADLFTVYYLNIVDLGVTRKFYSDGKRFTEVYLSINIANLFRH